MSNSLGGVMDVTGEITGLTSEQIEEYDRVISQVADNLKLPVYVATEVVKIEQDGARNVLIVHIQEVSVYFEKDCT